MTQEERSRLIFRATHLGALLATLLGALPLLGGSLLVHLIYIEEGALEGAVYLYLLMLLACFAAYPPGLAIAHLAGALAVRWALAGMSRYEIRLRLVALGFLAGGGAALGLVAIGRPPGGAVVVGWGSAVGMIVGFVFPRLLGSRFRRLTSGCT
jgi:hypothetical protein